MASRIFMSSPFLSSGSGGTQVIHIHRHRNLFYLYDIHLPASLQPQTFDMDHLRAAKMDGQRY